MRQGANITLSSLRATVHLGAHADAPSHYGADAPSIEAQDLGLYLGPCQVVRVGLGGSEATVTPASITAAITEPRVLIHTGTYPDPTIWNTQFASLSPDLISMLADRGVKLVGIDTPSVDRFESQDLPTHRACLERGVAILEGLVLSAIPEGRYELIALPLRLVGFDASPVRAVLRTLTP